MSGGHFDYSYHRVNEFTDRLEMDIKNNKKEDEYGYSYDYSDETIYNLTRVLHFSKMLSEIMKEVEWMYSGDTGEDDFNKEYKSFINELKAIINIESK